MSDRDFFERFAIREVLERYMRVNDDGDIDSALDLFDEDARYQVVGRIFRGHEEIKAFWLSVGWSTGFVPWTEPGRELVQPRSSHISSNPIIDVQGDVATAESDFLVVDRGEDGRAKLVLVGRYRDRLGKGADGRWRFVARTGVSVARPGAAGTDSEWRTVLERPSAGAEP
jgi:ketosteroid isomerase-like protein